ncbi:tRNA (adenosine(37)-N6)-dimethylallyltransferase MiaA [Coraliomargarita sp. SDUM461004]|uniref:tRNA dimethylallyltransferase n=1 Tax=Thalassobacterium sedimentorum TaxID=3041258 RepID=A0ABU1AIF3_9BACT|nr:tRNA (adenosine(37)-N6)-dimethylallyltransferase MiaA [Coraliomargarita sp. SDUM461004]MDQ8193566.1 tRNA (adenosine(37)-N6)-dimethylallyltransferase MiaA [Coraliomargarita sp. SDUM461004]
MKQSLHIITGPTAVGKTEYALGYAQAHDAEIVSCDASLVYRGMDIGTAKPTHAELARVPHHLIDLCPVNEPYDIVAYVRDAQAAVEAIFRRGKSVVVTGGSGFYLKSFFAPVIDVVKVSDEVRAAVATLYEAEGLEGLLMDLRERSPAGFGNLDIKNPRRVLRALERCIASGKDLLTLQAEFAARPEPYGDCSKHYILLGRDKENLKQRVAHRADLMLQQGLIEEVEALLKLGLQANPSAASAIGYRETIAFLAGDMRREELLSSIVQNTLHLVKKQGTWFRTQIRQPDETVFF